MVGGYGPREGARDPKRKGVTPLFMPAEQVPNIRVKVQPTPKIVRIEWGKKVTTLTLILKTFVILFSLLIKNL